MAGSVWLNDYTMIRSLMFDFSDDDNVSEISSEYMFGSSLLVCPVTEPMYYKKNSIKIDSKKIWKCYLPSGHDWYEMNSKKFYKGGKWVEVYSPIDYIPCFVMSGAVIPMENELEFASEVVKSPLEIHVYRGYDGKFVFYDDAGDGYDYEKGEYQLLEMNWAESESSFSLSDCKGNYKQGIVGRTLKIILHSEHDTIEKELLYKGINKKIVF